MNNISSYEIILSIKKTLKLSDNYSPIQLHEPCFTNSNAWSYVKDCLDTGWVSTAGKWVNKFEDMICNYTRAKHSIAVTNGTVGLRLALNVIGVNRGDEVIIPPMSFVATANAIKHIGAIPHFVDIKSEDLGICPNSIENRLKQIAIKQDNNVINKETGRKIKAIIAVHVYGLPASIKEIKKIADKWNLKLIEDSAEALGSWINDEKKSIHCGLIGDIGVLSFNGNKIITTGGGGALITNNKNYAKKAKHISQTAKIYHKWEYEHDDLGWNDRLPNINAALGCAQLENLEITLQAKRKLKNKYLLNFKNHKELEIIEEKPRTTSNYWLITARITSMNISDTIDLRNKILNESHEKGILLRPCWKLLSELKMYKSNPCGKLNIAKEEYPKLINFPSSPQLYRK